MEKNYFEIMFEKLCSKLKTEGKVKSISEDFGKLTTDYDRVDFLMKVESVGECVKLPDDFNVVGGKSLEKSLQLRTEGNKFFKGKNFPAALQNYTKSLASSPQNLKSELTGTVGDCLSVAFANRSAVLVHLEEHRLAIGDVENAFRYGYPQELAYKLHERKARCLLAIGDSSSAQKSFQEALESIEKSQLDVKNQRKWKNDIEKEIAKCKNCNDEKLPEGQFTSLASKWSNTLPDVCDGNNSTYVSLSKACDVKYETGRGRFIIAVRDISPGEVLLVEKPYASVVLSDCYTDHCYHCFAYILAPSFVCPGCSYALYCSENCQILSQNAYHRFECPILGALHVAGVDKFAYLALRTLAATPLNQVLDYRKAFDSGDYPAKDGNLVGSSQYVPHDYRAIYGLVTHADNRYVHDLFRRAVIAIFLVKCLQHSNYFASVDADKNVSDVYSHVGGLLLGHLQSYPCNAHEISEFGLDTNAVAQSVPHELGAGIYATLSLFNHSCDPTVSRNFYADVCVVRAIKGIKIGCEVSDNYGAVFAVQPQHERRNKLRAQYFFDCRCEACVNNWPLLPDLKSGPPTWRCSDCTASLHGTTSDSSVACTNCGRHHDLSQNLKELVESGKSYRVAFDKLLKCDVAEALPCLLSHLAMMDRLICVPWMDYSCCQEAVKQCFSIMANCYIKNKLTVK